MHMTHRSWLFVPGDSEDLLTDAVGTGADVIVVDLADAVSRGERVAARSNTLRWLNAHRRQLLGARVTARWVRINSLDSGQWRDDLVAIMPGAPDGLILPRSVGQESVRELAAELYEIEQRCQVPAGSTRIMPSVGDTAAATMLIGTYCDSPHQRLAGLTWSGEALAQAIGATRLFEGRGGWADSFRTVRAQTLLAAHAAQLMAIECAWPGDDAKAAKAAALAARADGFTGMFTSDPAQVAAINTAFTPSDGDVAQARAIVSAFADNPGFPALQVDGRIVEHTQLRHARRMLGMDGPAADEPVRSPILRPA